MGPACRQPGGWIFSILPFIDQQNIYALQMGLTSSSSPTKASAVQTMLSTPLAALNCPSRRALVAYPTWETSGSSFASDSAALRDRARPTSPRPTTARNGGDTEIDPSIFGGPNGPTTYAAGVSTSGLSNWKTIGNTADGVIYAGSQISTGAITDGTSNTYLVGEKSICPDNYLNGSQGDDNENAYMGDNEDICRWGGPSISPPAQDTPGVVLSFTFGSAIRVALARRFATARCTSSVSTSI